MTGLEEVERRIEALAGSATETSVSLRQLIQLHEQKAALLDEGAADARKTAGVLREALGIFEHATESLPFPKRGFTLQDNVLMERTVWEWALDILREVKKPLTAGELAERIKARGKDLGEQATANVTNALRRYVERGEYFYRDKGTDGYVYGLLDWVKEEKKSEGLTV